MRVAIVGAGMAGLACAETLVAGGHEVRLLDKGRGAGGRMSTRRVPTVLGDASIDHGAQYFTVRDAAFATRVARWAKAGIVARWPAAGADAWVGTPGMNAPIRQMAASLDVRWLARVDALSRDGGQWRMRGDGIDEGGFDAALVAVPAEQAAPLLASWDSGMAARAAETPSLPCWTVMAAFSGRVPCDPDIFRGDGMIGWAARDGAKPGRSGPESWVIQAGPEWSEAHLEDHSADVAAALVAAFADLVGAPCPETLAVIAHRWRYARSGRAGAKMLWNPALRLGAGGDWLLGPRVECAWLSGAALGGAVVSYGQANAMH